jgi:hypothetical protein
MNMNTTFALCLFVCLMSTELRASQWLPQGPGGGDVYAITRLGRRFIASTETGVYVSDNDGVTFALSERGIHMPVTSGRLSADGGVLIYATKTYGTSLVWHLYESLDSATSWQELPFPSSVVGVVGLVYYRNTIVVAGSGMVRSTNNGRSWEVLSVPGCTPQQPWISALSGVYAQDGNSFILFAQTSVPVYRRLGGPLRSTDLGTTWMAYDTNGTYYPEPYFLPPFRWQGKLLSYSTQRNITVSTDDGISWLPYPTPPLYNNSSGFAAVGDTLYCATSGGVFRSTDNGASWAVTFRGLETSSPLCLYAEPGRVLTGLSTGDLDAGSRPLVKLDATSGIAISTNGGDSWQLRCEGLLQAMMLNIHHSGDWLAASGTGTGLIERKPNDSAWHLWETSTAVYNQASTEAFVHAPGGDVTLLANMTTPAGSDTTQMCTTFRKMLNDTAFTCSSVGLEGNVVLQYLVDSSAIDNAGPIVYAVCRWGALFRSTDAGYTWHLLDSTRHNSGSDTMIVGALTSPARVNRLFWAGPFGIVTSTDGGLHWISTSPSQAGSRVRALCAHNGTMYVASDSGLFATLDGVSFTRRTLPQGVYIRRLESVGKMLVALGEGSLMASDDEGMSWRDISPLPYYFRYTCATLLDSLVLVGTWKRSIWSRPYAELDTLSSVNEVIASREAGLLDIYPNPISTTVNAPLTLALEEGLGAKSSVDLRDLLGRPLWSEYLPGGAVPGMRLHVPVCLRESGVVAVQIHEPGRANRMQLVRVVK